MKGMRRVNGRGKGDKREREGRREGEGKRKRKEEGKEKASQHEILDPPLMPFIDSVI